MIGIQTDHEYCSTIAHLLTGRKSTIPQTTKTWMQNTLSSLQQSDNIYNYSVSTITSPHKWLFHIIIRPNLQIDHYEVFIRLSQDNKCSYELRHRPWGEIHHHDSELQEFIGQGGWRKDFGQL